MSARGRVSDDALLRRALSAVSAERRLRHAREVSAALAAIAVDPDAGDLDRLARRSRALLEVEELIDAEGGGAVCLGVALERLATAIQFSCPVARDMVTSMAPVEVPSLRARAVMAAVWEWVAFAASVVPPGRAVRLVLASELQEGALVLAFAIAGAEDRAVPTGSGARSLRRAGALVRLLGGGDARGMRDGMLVVGAMLELLTREAGAGRG